MSLPDLFVLEDSPVSGGDVVRQITLDHALPQSQKEIGVIQNRQMHEIHIEDPGNTKCDKLRKKCGLIQSSLEAKCVILGEVLS